MIITPGLRRTSRDPGISEAIEELDRPERYGKPDLLSRVEIEFIKGEMEQCMADFSYASRNYFWITDKYGADLLLDLNESQEIILVKLAGLRAKGKQQKLLCVKARQLGCSTLIEALMAWRAMFFRNVNGLIISHTPEHAAYLFGMMQHIYDRMPWWLKPMCSSREYKTGLIFENPKPDQRSRFPGLNSRIIADGANSITGVGQGITISFLHASEASDWPNAESILEGDVGNALVESPDTIAVIESTAKGAGAFFHKLWLKNVELGERAEWLPLFLPWFFEKRRISIPPIGWKVEQPEDRMRERVEQEWVKCGSEQCGSYFERFLRRVDATGQACPSCGAGKLSTFTLAPEQLYWMEIKRVNAEKSEKSLKELRTEQCSTSEEAFQLGGYQVFPTTCIEFVNSTVREPVIRGFLDANLQLHGVDSRTGTCPSPNCGVDHSYEDLPLLIWGTPREDGEYVIGADVAEGGGGVLDYSVGWVNYVNRKTMVDEHVATWRSNTVDAIGFAYELNRLGRWFNEAMLSIELNAFTTTADYVRFQLQYPNLYRWKNLDSMNVLTQRLGWLTRVDTKPRLYQTAIRWLKTQSWIIRSKNCLNEITSFQREDENSKQVGAAIGAKDDEIMAAMICLYTTHEAEFDETLGYIPIVKKASLEAATWIMTCTRCGEMYPAENPDARPNCPKCGSLNVIGSRNSRLESSVVQFPSIEDTAYFDNESKRDDYDTL